MERWWQSRKHFWKIIMNFNFSYFHLKFSFVNQTKHFWKSLVHWHNQLTRHSSFSQTHKVGNVGIIANFVFTHICSFLLYLDQLMWVNVKLEIKVHMRNIFQGYIFYLTSWFLMTELKQSWQCWHSCIMETSWNSIGNKSLETTALDTDSVVSFIAHREVTWTTLYQPNLYLLSRINHGRLLIIRRCPNSSPGPIKNTIDRTDMILILMKSF